MKKLYFLFSVILITSLSLVSSAVAASYSSDFKQYLSENPNEKMVKAIITMVDQVDLPQLKAELYARHANRQEWHETVVLALQEKATVSQAEILAQLIELEASGQVSEYRGLWIGNIVLVTATPEALDILVNRDDVLQVSPDYTIESIKPVHEQEDAPLIASHEIGLERIHADEVWALGYTGEGRLVSHLDTGVDGNHEALSARWRGLDPRYADNPEWAWFDPLTNTRFPFDSGVHGTHTMGTITGMSLDSGDTIGVAFGAEWISACVIDRIFIPQTVHDALLSFEWLVDPDGDPSTVWDVPDVCSNSWGITTEHGYPPCDQTFWVALDNLEAAGCVVIFAAGNEGPDAYSLRRPADRATTNLSSFAIGAVDGNNPNLPIADFSSRGPSNCTPNGSDTIKPEVSAPGVNVRSSMPGGGYGTMSGTSMACPHVAGIVALIRNANPDLTTDQVKQIILDAASDLGPDGEDNDYGMGIVDAYESVIMALAYLEGWGALAGQITDQDSGEPINGAVVSVVDRPWRAISRQNGWYYLFMPADTIFNIRVDYPPIHLPIFDQQQTIENDTIIVNYVLEGKITVILTSSFANPEDADYRSFYLKGSWDNDGFYDEAWSGDYIEIKDNGEAPDQMAGDGIFTAELLLVRDEVNTYSWATYSENYGGEDARLDNGADFDIPDLNSPIVPTLEVNPSGSDNNWIISAEGDNGLSLDLSRGVDSNPHKWSATDSLYDGITYTFRFHVMHSDVASYGSGGLGGPDLTFTSEVDGVYDFIFNDFDDSYLVQMVGTEGPPTYLSAQSGFDGHIPLGWLAPGTSESIELAYDDGEAANAYFYFTSDNLMATMFIPESYPVFIDSVMVHVLTEGDPYWPWPDGSHDPVGVSIFLDNGTGYPEPDPVFYTETTAELGERIRVDVGEIVVTSGNFWVAMNNLSDSGPYDGMGLDVYTDYPANKWAREDGAWNMQDDYPGDHMIRSKVFSADVNTWLGYDSVLPAGEISPRVRQSGNLELVSGTGGANAILPGTEKLAPVSRVAYHPQILSERSLTTDTQVLAGYNLYRDTSPEPFDRDMQINSELITENSYDDWGDDLYGPIVNSALYYYQASAVYDVGGGNFVEVGPSNEATGAAENYPPSTPEGLAGDADGDVVTLNWEPNSDYDIASYNIYRSDYNQSDFNLVGNVVHPTTTYSETIELDGIYRYKLKAVDAEGMESEGFSDYVDVAVGLIPPGILSASDDEEFKIELSWRNPGGLLTETQNLEIGVVIADYDAAEQEVVDYLIASGEVSSAAFIDCRNSTPTFAELEPYDMLIVWTNYQPQDPYGLGDALADYVETGKGVVALEFTFNTNWGVNGRFIDEYSPFGVTSNGFMDVSLGEYDANHPLMENVFALTDYYVFNVPLQNNAEVVAYWSNGWPAVAFNTENPNVVCINGYVGLPYHRWTGNMLELLLNSVRFTSGGQGIQPDGFALYKSDNEEGPFDMLATLPGTQNDYDDEPVPNDVPYYYQVTALWDDEESDPSNTAMGVGENHQPEPPTNLEATVDYYDVNLTWSFTDLMGDFNHYNIYSKLVGDTLWTLDGTSETESYTALITPGEDSVYLFAVTAIDDGYPQLESDYSNIAFAPVGNLPPLNLAATGNQESVVPLRWSEPGMRPCTIIAYDDGVLANAYYYFASDNIMANRFVATAPVEICTVWVHVLTEDDPLWPWPDGNHDPVEVTIWEGDGNGYPGTMLHSEITQAEYGEWIMVAFESPLMCNDDMFWVGMNNLSDTGPYDGIGLDANTDYPEHKWAREFGTWSTQDTNSGDHMIRASIISSGLSMILSEENPTSKLAIRNNSFSSKSLGMIKPITSFSSSVNISIADGTTPRILDTQEMLGYNIYRDTEADVPIDDDYKINSAYIVETNYDDEDVINGTTYYYVVCAVYDNDGNIELSPPSNEESATPMTGGNLSVDPTSIETSAYAGEQSIVPMTLSNSGGLPVSFTISATVSQALSDIEISYRGNTAQAKFQSYSEEYDKSEQPSEPDNPPVITDQGGPDEFGYRWIDSDEPNGPTYEWIDITSYGNPVSMYDDENQGPFPMEFDFPFYDQIFSTFRICSNGFISFTSTSNQCGNQPIPDFDSPENLVAPFWDDMNPYSGGMIYWYSDAEATIVSWVDMPHFGSGGPYTYQVILRPNGTITYQYQTMYEPTNSATIGIQDASQTIGLQVAFDQYYVHDELAVRISAGWLSADPSGGVVQPGGDFEVDVICDASLLEDGEYEGTLTIRGWDENHNLPVITVPVTFLVNPTGIEADVVLLPKEFALNQNYPNPFNATTEIRYALPVNCVVTLEVFNLLGQKVTTIFDGNQQAGFHSVTWDGTNSSGTQVATGMYMYKLVTPEKTFVKKMLLLK